MVGKVLDYEAKTILNRGRSEGLAQGRSEGLKLGRSEGLKLGRSEGIRGTAAILKKMGIPAQTIRLQIQEEYHLSPEESEKYITEN